MLSRFFWYFYRISVRSSPLSLLHAPNVKLIALSIFRTPVTSTHCENPICAISPYLTTYKVYIQ